MSNLNLIMKFMRDMESVPVSPYSLKYGLDWDGTVTSDPVFWLLWCILAKQRGHKVYIVTMRYPSECVEIPSLFLENVEGIYPTSREPKQQHMLKHDIVINVWIDDNPKAVYQDAKQIWGSASKEGEVVTEGVQQSMPAN